MNTFIRTTQHKRRKKQHKKESFHLSCLFDSVPWAKCNWNVNGSVNFYYNMNWIRNSSADEMRNVNFLRRRCIRTTKYNEEHWLDLSTYINTSVSCPSRKLPNSVKLRCGWLLRRSRSPILVPIESSYTTSYYWLIVTYLRSCTVSKL